MRPLWVPSDNRKRDANITRFMERVNRTHGLHFATYPDLHEWSVREIPDFWAAMWEFAELRASRAYEAVVDDIRRFPGARWFPGAQLNFAENLLRYRDDQPALIFRGESQARKSMTYGELAAAVGQLASALRAEGVQSGDRVVGYMPNLIETAVAMLAATSLGATWASCATDIGPAAALERLGQVDPKVLFTADGYYYKGKAFDTLANGAALARAMPTLKRVIVARNIGEGSGLGGVHNAVGWDEYLERAPKRPLEFAQLPFDHPGFIMFSSGTTGKPKCIVQSAGGVLLNHLKELLLHTDLKRSDRILYITSCSWMMWNWLLSSLAVGATVVLYEGNPNYPDLGAMWRIVDEERISVFGCSASYLLALEKSGFNPREDFRLDSLREISQTGSALSAAGFEFVYRDIKPDLHFNSISGGTDINGCFAAGTPIQPVYAGQLQGAALGMKVKAYDSAGRAVCDEEGELVCEAPSPSMPIAFWEDADGAKYRRAYFETFPGVWRHGDYVRVDCTTGGITFFGRSDAVLKPSGVRIGTAEIYSQLEQFPEIADALAVGQDFEGDQRVVLFVKLAAGSALTDDLKRRVKERLRANASPRHVPAVILEAPDIPYTLNMKKVEIAVGNVLNGRPVSNHDALANPESLEYFRTVAGELVPRP